MDEASFLAAIADSPDDKELLRVFADWLTEHGDPRGEYLQLELDRRAAETQLLETKSRIRSLELGRFGELDPAWLDQLIPLQVVSPMVGRFYVAPKPDAEPYVKIGDTCDANTIVGIIETMKVFNEIPAGHAGVISEILVSNDETVEYGQPLVRLTRPSYPEW